LANIQNLNKYHLPKMAIHKNLSASTWSFLKIQFPKEGNETKVIGFLLRMEHLLRRKKYWKSQAKVVGSDDGWECRSHLLKRERYKITRCGCLSHVSFDIHNLDFGRSK